MDQQLRTLKEKRELARLMHGSDSKEYNFYKNKIIALNRDQKESTRKSYVKKVVAEGKATPKEYGRTEQQLSCTTTTCNIHGDFERNKLAYKNLSVVPKPNGKVSCSVFGGKPLRPLHLIPTLDDAKEAIPGYKPKSKVVEGGILDYIPSMASELSNEEKNNIINIVGRGFARFDDEEDPEFSFLDANVTHQLLYKHGKTTVAVKIEYSYTDETTGKPMIALAGAIIFSQDLTLYKHNNGKKTRMNNNTCKVYNMVQFTVLYEFSQRGLGAISLQAIETIMDVTYNADLVYWCGCAQHFYEICGSSKNPVMITCPFDIETTDEKNRAKFFYVALGKGRKFQKNVVEFYNQDPSNRKFSIEYKNDTLKTYYGLLRNDNDKENDGGFAGNSTNDSIVDESPSYDIVDHGDGDGTTISIQIAGYDTRDLKYDITGNGGYLIVSGIRKDTNKMYKFEINFKLDPVITETSMLDGDYAKDSVLIKAKTKVTSHGYSRY